MLFHTSLILNSKRAVLSSRQPTVLLSSSLTLAYRPYDSKTISPKRRASSLENPKRRDVNWRLIERKDRAARIKP